MIKFDLNCVFKRVFESKHDKPFNTCGHIFAFSQPSGLATSPRGGPSKIQISINNR